MLVLSALSGAGCQPPPPSEEALLSYLGNARFHGPVRRAWPAGQAYLDKVMQHERTLERELSLLGEHTTTASLWAAGDPRWQEQATLKAHLDQLDQLMNADGTHAQARQKELDALTEALEAVPEELKLTHAGKIDFVVRAWNALGGGRDAVRGTLAEDEKLVGQRRKLYQAVWDDRASLDAAKMGLHFKDAELQDQIDAQYASLQKTLREDDEQTVRYAERRLVALAPQIKQCNKREDRSDYELLTNEDKYWRDALAALAKVRRAAADQLTKEAKKAERAQRKASAATTQPSAQVAEFYQARAAELRSEARTLEAQTEQIIARAKEAAARVSTGEEP